MGRVQIAQIHKELSDLRERVIRVEDALFRLEIIQIIRRKNVVAGKIPVLNSGRFFSIPRDGSVTLLNTGQLSRRKMHRV